MIDASYIKVHPHGTGARGVDAFGMPLRIQIMSGTLADCRCADSLMEGISAKYLLADRAYDTDQIIERATEAQIEAVVPPKRN